jgi:hypothetical protein
MLQQTGSKRRVPETVFKEKHGVWDPWPELTITSPYVDYRVDLTHVPWATLCQGWPETYATVDFIPQSGTKNFASEEMSQTLQPKRKQGETRY